MSSLKEKDVIDYMVRNWEALFKEEELHFYKREMKITDSWRVDIMAYVLTPHPDIPDKLHRTPVYIEVKFNHNDRDLIFELEKGLRYVNRSDRDPKFPRYLAVIVDDTIDEVSLSYIKKNNIPCYMYTIEKEDLATMKIQMFTY